MASSSSSLSEGNGNNRSLSSLPPAPLPSNHKRGGGALIATILSVYDLPLNEPPLCVSLQAGSAVVKTGPPTSRHKDRNSFRFVSKQMLRIDAALRDLYPTSATLTVEYPNPDKNWKAQVVLKTLPIQETTWLILNLEPASTTSNNGGGRNGDTDDAETPTLRLQMRLEGPYRTEIGAIVACARQWFGIMDGVEQNTKGLLKGVPEMPSAKLLLVPTVPIVAATVVLAPVLAGVLVVGLPVFLPILVVVLGVVAATTLVGGALWASTSTGRSTIGGMMAPMVHTLLSTESGQVIVYETGARPTPVSVARTLLPTGLWGKLVVSLLIDLVGSSSYLIPVAGEALDLGWAPIQTILIMAMYDSVSPNLKYVSFVEEILPFTDVVPSATIGWVSEFGPQILPLGGTQNNGGAGVKPTSMSSSSAAIATKA